ncbi:MAG: FtsW/RodA/SpoVE family cell cycle protein [Coriobacteriales bacterium]|jgi:peptidoglycan glycosyltransferase|nr:FtsW/RodA/SpoVE family cell cycle protein [Coriobacteriales bacterium]
MNRRTTELLLLLAASPVIILLFILAILNDGEPLNIQTLAVPLGLFAAFIASHLAIRKLAPNADPALLPITFALSGIGIAFVMRLAPELAGRQVLWLFVGIAAMIATLLIVRSIRKLGTYKYTLMLAGIILLILPAVIGVEHYGSKIWLSLGGFSFQPGEVAKVLIALFLAAYLADNREMLSVAGKRIGNFTVPDLRTLAPLLLMWVVSLFIVVFERDLGSALLFFGLFLIMLYVATGRRFYVLCGGVLALVGVVAAYFLFTHVQARFDTWIDPWAYKQTTGWQLTQALYSLADGDLFGTGIGRGMPELIPVVASDFIFAAIAEEMGLLGASAVLLLYLLFAVRGFTIASRAHSDVDAFTAVGLTVAISFQAFVIVGGVTQFIPLTGVTLPFMSQGGSSLLASFIIVGLLLRAGDSGSGLEKELQGTTTLDGSVLGRVTLGRRLTIVITGFACLFALLIGNLTWHMVIDAEHVREEPGNSHTVERTQNVQRGTILTSDGVVLAYSAQDAEGNWIRSYPEGSLATHVVGYTTRDFGAAGVESRYAETLSGQSDFANWENALDALAGSAVPGNDVRLTLNAQVQRSSEAELEGEVGGVVVLDAETGATLALASAPTYNTNDVVSILGATGDDGTGLGGGNSVLFNRATQALYAPGSTFKIVTLSAALTSSSITLDSSYDAPASLEIGNAPITNHGNDAFGIISLKTAFAYSSNTVFAQVADELGASSLVQAAERFGFNQTLNTDFDVTTSLMPDPSEMTQWETAWAGVGQPVGTQGGGHKSPAGPQATVLQMAMVGSAVANDGILMKPYVVDCVLSSEGKAVSTTTPTALYTPLSPGVAAKVQDAMLGVVTGGTGMEAQVGGYTVYGKTGTAQTSRDGRDVEDSWFVGYIEIKGHNYVVAIVVEDADSGSASRKAQNIFESLVVTYG